MAIDSVRLLTDSAAHVWRRLSAIHSLEAFIGGACFEDWLGPAPSPPFNQAEEQALRRDYHLLANLLTELESLLHSREQAIALVRSEVAALMQRP
jgi:hypothetical protein